MVLQEALVVGAVGQTELCLLVGLVLGKDLLVEAQ
jgi:hypothetical protein